MGSFPSHYQIKIYGEGASWIIISIKICLVFCFQSFLLMLDCVCKEEFGIWNLYSLMLKHIYLVIFFFVVAQELYAQGKNDSIPSDSLRNLFDGCFKKIDADVAMAPTDTVFYCCTPQIHFMEKYTGIKSRSEYTSFGKLWFHKEDWVAWHKWYSDHLKDKDVP